MNKELSQTVVKSNVLIQQSYKLGFIEQQVVLACIAKIDSTAPLNESMQFELHASEFVDIFKPVVTNDEKTDLKSTYRDLLKASKTLAESTFTFVDVSGISTTTSWFQSVQYRDGLGKIVVRFPYVLTPHLSELKKNFTQYSIIHVAGMKSVYGCRLYELLMQWHLVGQLELSIDEINRLLGVNHKYKAMKDFKSRVIDPAIKDINEHSDFNVEWSQRKTGREVSHLIFTFIKKKSAIEPAIDSTSATESEIATKPKTPAKKPLKSNVTASPVQESQKPTKRSSANKPVAMANIGAMKAALKGKVDV